MAMDDLTLTMMPAAEGDALWLRWGPADDRRQLLIDLGVHATGLAFLEMIEELPVEQRHFDLLVVTHVDTDHIYGILSALVDPEDGPPEGLRFGDVWFNGWTHLCGEKVPVFDLAEAEFANDAKRHFFGNAFESYGGPQGEQFSFWLRKELWNHAFDGGPVVRADKDALGPTVELAHGLRVTVLGPTTARLANLQNEWRKDVAAALKKDNLDPDEVTPDLVPDDFEAWGKTKPKKPNVSTQQKLRELAARKFRGDKKAANGSSIALLLEYGEVRLVLAGDAHAPDLVDALNLVPRPDGGDGPLPLTAFKLPHHGSKNNVSEELIQAVDCGHWLFSTNGVKHYHPDAEAVARVVVHSSGSVLCFNEPSTYNGWWDNDDWRETHGYSTVYGVEGEGLTLHFAADGSVVRV
jgi:hypothetical protein